MGERLRHAAALAAILIGAGALGAQPEAASRPAGRQRVIDALIARSRLLSDVKVQIPSDLYRRYLLESLRSVAAGPDDHSPACIVRAGRYHVKLDAAGSAVLSAEVVLHVFRPDEVAALPVLSAKLGWETVAVNGKAATLPSRDGWLVLSPASAGAVTVRAEVKLGKRSEVFQGGPAERSGANDESGRLMLPVAGSVQTLVAFDAPGALEVRAEGALPAVLSGEKGRGTHGAMALPPTDRLDVRWGPVQPKRRRPPRYELSGSVAWTLDAGVESLDADLRATVAGGPSDRVVLTLPGGAERVTVSGPEVRQVQVAAGEATVHLKGELLGSTPLRVSLRRPAGGDRPRLEGFGISRGRWTGGVLVIGRGDASTELLGGASSGLVERAVWNVPREASALLPAPVAMAYDITGRSFAAGVEVLRLGEFALRESIADLAHYEAYLDDDGAVVCRAKYEIRNRGKQFLRLTLPAGARILLAKVNDRACPVAPVGRTDWLLPLERSRPTVKGLVSFPVEVAFTCRTAALTGEGTAELPLPRIDLPIAYAWCELYVPEGLRVSRWGGAMRVVTQFSAETAVASLDYGSGELARGHARPTRPTAPAPQAPSAKPTPSADQPIAAIAPPAGSSAARPQAPAGDPKRLLARNAFRAGKDLYEKGQYNQAEGFFRQVRELAPGSNEAVNADRYSSNIRVMSEGKLAGLGRAAQAAGIQLKREAEEQTREQVRQQDTLIAKGEKLAQAGDLAKARLQLEAAYSTNAAILARQKFDPKLIEQRRQIGAKLAEVRGKQQAQSGQLQKEVQKLKKSGEYDKALKVAEEAARLEDNNAALRQEMKVLALAAARQRTDRLKEARAEDGKKPSKSAFDAPAGGREPAKPVDETVTRIYDVRDLITRVPTFAAEAAESADQERNAAPAAAATQPSRAEMVRSLTETLRQSVAGKADVQVANGQLIVRQAGDPQAVERLLSDLRRARGAQVEAGGKLALQKAGGVVDGKGNLGPPTGEGYSYGLEAPHGGAVKADQALAKNAELKRFIASNYAWALDGKESGRAGGPAAPATDSVAKLPSRPGPGVGDGGWVSGGGQTIEGQLVDALGRNWGQKVRVESRNVSVSAAAAEALGVRFRRGRNELTFATADEAQFRSLMELDASLAARGRRRTVNPSGQDAIVGTDALLANDDVANVTFAAERGNTLDVRSNPIALEHEKYLIIDNNDGTLTVARAGEMQHWSEKAVEPLVAVDVPQTIAPPRVGRLVKFERKLVQPSDRLVLQAEYTQKGMPK